MKPPSEQPFDPFALAKRVMKDRQAIKAAAFGGDTHKLKVLTRRNSLNEVLIIKYGRDLVRRALYSKVKK